MEPTYLSGAIVILLFSVILHEVTHGLAARFFGDRTAEAAGRLTLNPIPHIDPVGTILVPGILLLPALLTGTHTGFIIGWAKPVPVNPFNFSDIKKGELFTSLAGVASNFTLAILAAILYHLLLPILPASYSILLSLLQFTVTINLILGIFNLIPLPPLDGSKALASQLPAHLATEYQKLERYGLLIILFLWMVPIGGIPILSFIVRIAIDLINSILQVPLRLF